MNALCLKAGSDNVAAAYATALASLALDENKLEIIHSDIDRLTNIIKETEELTEFLSSPFVEENKRKEVLETICQEGGFDQDTINFLNLLMDKGRAGILEEICNAFEDEYCKMTNTQVFSFDRMRLEWLFRWQR